MQVLDSLIDGPLQLRDRKEGDELIGMIVRYLRTGEEPEPRTDAQRMALAMARPVMDRSRTRAESGAKGGAAPACGVPYEEVVDALNRAAGAHFRASTDKTRRSIRARAAEGFTLDDFRAVIEHKSREWAGTDMEKYLRPETLFGTKFEGYLQDARRHEGEVDPCDEYADLR